MSAASIQAKVKAGLAKAIIATGSATSELVYRVCTTQTGTPLLPATSETITLLPNAIFKSYEQGLTDVSIEAGDRELVSNADNEIKQNDVIRQGSINWIVISVNKVAPASEALVYFSQCRQQ